MGGHTTPYHIRRAVAGLEIPNGLQKLSSGMFICKLIWVNEQYCPGAEQPVPVSASISFSLVLNRFHNAPGYPHDADLNHRRDILPGIKADAVSLASSLLIDVSCCNFIRVA